MAPGDVSSPLVSSTVRATVRGLTLPKHHRTKGNPSVAPAVVIHAYHRTEGRNSGFDSQCVQIDGSQVSPHNIFSDTTKLGLLLSHALCRAALSPAGYLRSEGSLCQ